MGGVGVSEDGGLGRGMWSGPGLGAGDFLPSAELCCEGQALPESFLPSPGDHHPDQSDCTAQGPHRVGHP